MKIRKFALLAIVFMCLSTSLTLAEGTEQASNLSVDIGAVNSDPVPNSTAIPVDAPLNPDFLEYRERISRNIVFAEADAGASGLIPSPVDFSRLNSLVFSTEPEIPSAYDLRAEGRVTPAKDQGGSGACWAFATLASLESGLTPSEIRDFSENNMKNLLSSQYSGGFDREHDDGGNDLMAAAYLTRWSGPVDEADDPYNDVSGASPGGLSVQKHVQNIFFMPLRSNSLDNENIKRAIMEYGVVYTTIHSYGLSGSYYDSTHNNSYYPYSRTPDHAVSIVGWNDSYPAEYFSKNPGGDGAFIVKNSWGDDWGENGYCYVSYYDAVLGKKAENSVFLAEDSRNYDRIYQYDPLGWTSKMGYGGTETAWQANVFTAESAETLRAVSFYTVNSNTEYLVRIYLNPDSGPLNREGDYVFSQNGSFTFSGYHTLSLENGVNLSSGQSFSVVVKLSTPGETTPLVVEKLLDGYSSQAEASSGESYISSDGISWEDLTTLYDPANSIDHRESNFCIKAFISKDLLPEAAFSANTTSGVRPLTVEFTDSSAHARTWAWDVDGDEKPDYDTQNLSDRKST
ncbi:MAG: lectin like domain-containing protein, partial [Methanosarcinaceae archaeon]|nr:lectin like domain-containing protein [Methanosarcinaceae archaeon]